jgi:hypothetical protein
MMIIHSKDQIYNICSVELIKLYNNLPSQFKNLKNMYTTFQKEAKIVLLQQTLCSVEEHLSSNFLSHKNY